MPADLASLLLASLMAAPPVLPEPIVCVPAADGRSWICGSGSQAPQPASTPRRPRAGSSAPPPLLMDPRRMPGELREALDRGEAVPSTPPAAAPATAAASDQRPPSPPASSPAVASPTQAPAAPASAAAGSWQAGSTAKERAVVALPEDVPAQPALPIRAQSGSPGAPADHAAAANSASLAAPAATSASAAPSAPTQLASPGTAPPPSPPSQSATEVTPGPQPEPPSKPAESGAPAIVDARAQPAVPAQSQRSIRSEARDGRELLTLPASAYTVQLAATRGAVGYTELRRELGIAVEDTFVIRVRRGSEDWWLLLWREFPDLDSARQAASSLPGGDRFWPRRLAPLQAEVRSSKALGVE